MQDPEHGLFLCGDGTWLHDGDPVTHPRLADLLHASIARDTDGQLCVTTGRDRLPFTCEDLPLRVLWVEQNPDGVMMHLSNGREELLDPGTLVVDRDHRWRCLTSAGLGARFSRPAQLQLMDSVEEDTQGEFMLRVGARTVALKMDAPQG